MENEIEQEEDDQVFSKFVCRSVNIGQEHPGDVSESSTLSATLLPQSNYPFQDSITNNVIDSGQLSKLQLEGIFQACARHQELVNGQRAGFMIGDGAGVGKGRQIAGIIVDNFVRGRRKALWISISSDLEHDARRDIRDIGANIKVYSGIKDLHWLSKNPSSGEGVLFVTYSLLISTISEQSRMTQVVKWLGGENFKGALVFDEAHKAKNFNADGGKSTKVSQAVIDIQQRLKQARVVYCSATGVSDVSNMAYLDRLQLWGNGSGFDSFKVFKDTMKKRGINFLELLTMELKSEGKYVARALSFRSAEFQEVESQLTSKQIAIYNYSVEIWIILAKALTFCKNEFGIYHNFLNPTQIQEMDQNFPRRISEVFRLYYSAQQRYFKILCVCLKVPTIVEKAKQALQEGNCVVIGLQSTGEAAVEFLSYKQGQVCGFVSVCKEILKQFITKHFPESPVTETDIPGSHPIKLIKQRLLELVETVQLPVNPLDQLIDELGGPEMVAELTGRKGRIIRNHNGKGVYQQRDHDLNVSLDNINMKEKTSFADGRKLVAIISDAASTGISLHASLHWKNQRRRIHITIELPWSADKAIQQLGRTHRSYQASAPLYLLVTTPIGGERRFISAVAKRLQVMGALTRGDRRAASGLDLSEFNLDTPLGRNSHKSMISFICMKAESLPQDIKIEDIFQGIPMVTTREDEQTDQFRNQQKSADPELAQNKKQLDSVTFKLRTNIPQELQELIVNYLKQKEEISRQQRAFEEQQNELDQNQQQNSSEQSDKYQRLREKARFVVPFNQQEQQLSAQRELIQYLHRELLYYLDIMLNSMVTLNNPLDQNCMEAMLDATTIHQIDSEKDIKKFLNRLLCIPIVWQGIMIYYISALYKKEIQKAKLEGDYVDQVGIIDGDKVTQKGAPQTLWNNIGSGRYQVVKYTEFEYDRGLSFEQACVIKDQQSLERKFTNQRQASFWIANFTQRQFGHKPILLAIEQSDIAYKPFKIYRPNTGVSNQLMEFSELRYKYTILKDYNSAKQQWDRIFDASKHGCNHGMACTVPDCNVGRRITDLCLLSGSVVRIWAVLERLIEKNKFSLNRQDKAMRVYRIESKNNDSAIIGLRYSASLIDEITITLQQEQMYHENLVIQKEDPAPVDEALKQKYFRKYIDTGVQNYFGNKNKSKQDIDDGIILNYKDLYSTLKDKKQKNQEALSNETSPRRENKKMFFDNPNDAMQNLQNLMTNFSKDDDFIDELLQSSSQSNKDNNDSQNNQEKIDNQDNENELQDYEQMFKADNPQNQKQKRGRGRSKQQQNGKQVQQQQRQAQNHSSASNKNKQTDDDLQKEEIKLQNAHSKQNIGQKHQQNQLQNNGEEQNENGNHQLDYLDLLDDDDVPKKKHKITRKKDINDQEFDIPWKDNLKIMMEMGFKHVKAVNALKFSDGDLQKAIRWTLQAA